LRRRRARLGRIERAVLSANEAGGGTARGVLRAWLLWDSVWHRLFRVTWVGPEGTIGVRRVRYRGPSVRLRDGTVVERGDEVLELHLNNARLSRLAATRPRGHWDALHAAKTDAADLMSRLAAGEFPGVKALHGVTLFGLAARWAGFEVRETAPGLGQRLQHLFLRGLARIYEPGPAPQRRPTNPGPAPCEVWWAPATNRPAVAPGPAPPD
jgi:hypothetical protein